MTATPTILNNIKFAYYVQWWLNGMNFRLNQFKSIAFKFVPRLDLKDVAKEDLDAQVGTQDKHGASLQGHEPHLLEN